jgi:cytochrome c-type biogenesis protein CcmH
VKPGTWLLWFTPFALVLAGAAAIVAILRRRAALQAAGPRADIDPGDDW